MKVIGKNVKLIKKSIAIYRIEPISHKENISPIIILINTLRCKLMAKGLFKNIDTCKLLGCDDGCRIYKIVLPFYGLIVLRIFVCLNADLLVNITLFLQR